MLDGKKDKWNSVQQNVPSIVFRQREEKNNIKNPSYLSQLILLETKQYGKINITFSSKKNGHCIVMSFAETSTCSHKCISSLY